MSTGKYSPLCPHAHESGWEPYKFNCYGKLPDPNFDHSRYDEKLHFVNYDDEGFDSYGYSAFDIDGNYIGVGDGIDRYGYTEKDYLHDYINGGNLYYDLQSYGGGSRMTSFVRNR